MRFLNASLLIPLLGAGPGFAAEAPPPELQADVELDEVLVRGRRPANTAERLTAWLSRLPGEFRYEGYVERRGDAGTALETAAVQGTSQCANLGAPGLVQCQMNVSWPERHGTGVGEMPGAVSWLTPAVAVYGLYVGPPSGPEQAPDSQYIGHMQVDGRGLAEIGLGQLFDDTLIYKAACADLSGNCQRVVQIEAPPDGGVIRMNVEIQRDSKLEARYVFHWHRTTIAVTTADDPQSVASVRPGSSIMPAAVHNWAASLVGAFRADMFVPGKTVVAKECAGSSPLEFSCDLLSSNQECQSIGSGPGVRCIRDMDWHETRVPASRSQAAFELWGYDPVARRMVTGIAFPASPTAIRGLGGMTFATGSLLGRTLTLTWLCPRHSDCSSEQTRVIIPPDGRHVRHLTGNRNEFRILTRVVDTSAPRSRNTSPRRP